MSDYKPKSVNTLPLIFDDRMLVNNLIPKIVNRVNDNTEDLSNLYMETVKLAEDVPDSPTTDGDYILRRTSGVNTYATAPGMDVVTVSGSTVTQTGVANKFYVCGTLATLTFTAPSSGICAIRFTSGSTPTVLTVSGVSYWMNGFDPTSLEASKTYEISILNGVGVVGC